MVYIAPIPKATAARRPRVLAGGQADATGDQGKGQDSKTLKVHQNQQQQQQGRSSKTKAQHGKASRKQQAEEQAPDPRLLLASQAALATQALQREQLQHSPIDLQQHEAHAEATTAHQAAAPLTLSLPRARERRQAADAHPQQQQMQSNAASQQQHRPRPPQQAAAASRQQQQQQQMEQEQLPQPKRGANHMFWDVPPRTINPALMPGLTDQPSATGQACPMDWADHTDAAAAAAGQQPEARQQQPAPAPASQQQHWQQPQWQLQHTGSDRQTTSDWAGGCQQSGPHHQREQSLPGASALVLDGGRSTAGAWATQQQQQQQRSVSAAGDKAAELAQELRAAEGHPDSGVRQRLVKEVKQQIYKLELEQQIAEREAARRASKAAAAAKEAAEAAARAAAPLPWDPAARLARRGGGGEPLKGMDGVPVTDLRSQRHMLPVPGLDVSSSQCFAPGSPTHEPHQLQPAHLAHSTSMPTAGSTRASPTRAPAAAASSSPGAVTPAGAPAALSAPCSFNRRGSDSMQGAPGGKCFMGSMGELRVGPSQEQRAAAAAARQQLQRDLEAQIAEKTARAEAQAAAAAARTAVEDAALQQYLLNKSSSQADVAVVGKEASMVYAAAGPLNAPLAQQPAAAAATAAAVSGAGSTAVVRKGRNKRVIDAPWLDQLKPGQAGHMRTSLQEQHMQLQQQISQLQLSSHHTLPHQPSQQRLSGSGVHAAAGGQLWQESSTFKPPGHSTAGAQEATASKAVTAGGASVADHVQGQAGASLSSHQLAAALQQMQELQQEQLRMWGYFRCQAAELQQLLTGKQAVAADRDAARTELVRVQDLLLQQKQLQDVYAGQQQVLLDLQQRQQQQQQQQPYYAAVHGSQRGSDQSEDCLDAFVVETQLVPISVNSIPGGGAAAVDTQAVSDLSPSAQQHLQDVESQSRLPAPTATASGRNHKSRVSSFYGLEAELSAVSVASQAQQSPNGGADRKARTRVSGSFKPSGTFPTGAGPSFNSSLAASTAFLPFQLSSLALLQQQQDGRDQQQQQQSRNAGPADAEAGPQSSTNRAQHRPRKAVGAAALAAAADAAVSAMASGVRSSRSSPVRTRGLGSPSRGGRNVVAAKGWAR